MGGAFGGEGAFHLGEQHQEQEGDTGYALVGGSLVLSRHRQCS